MGDLNPNANSPLGTETRFVAKETVQINSPTRAWAQRIRPGASTMTHDHLLLERAVGSPGLMVDHVTDLDPTTSEASYYPGTDTGATETNWEDASGVAANLTFADLDDPFDTASYAQNTNSQGKNARLQLKYRGNNAGAVTGRVLRVRIGCVAQLLKNTLTNGLTVTIAGGVTIDGTDYYGPGRSLGQSRNNNVQSMTRIDDLATFYLNPSTGLPWTAAEVDDILDALDADTMNFYVQGKLGDASAGGTGFRLRSFWAAVLTCTENRIGFFYRSGPNRAGYERLTMSGTSAPSANTWYWRVVGAPNADGQNFFEVPVMRGLWVPATDATDSTKEHRQSSRLTLVTPGGVAGQNAGDVDTATDRMLGGYLLEAAGPTILGQSQSVAATPALSLDAATPANTGTQSTGTAGVTYGGVVVTVGWASPTVRPTAPLIVEVRSGGGAITGGGTLHATAVLKPADTPDATVRDYQLELDVAFASAAVQYHLHFRSASLAGAGWTTPLQDSRSDATLSGTTVANIEGQTYGGQTDSYFTNGVTNDRYDLAHQLLVAPDPLANFTATSFAALPDEGAGTPTSRAAGVLLKWDPGNLGTQFGKIVLERRARRAVAEPWTTLVTLQANDRQTAAQVEAVETQFVDWEVGDTEEHGPTPDGWEYRGVVYTIKNLRSPEALDVVDEHSTGADTWEVCNDAWWLNHPLRVEAEPGVDSERGREELEPIAGEEYSDVQILAGVPATRVRFRWSRDQQYPSLEELRLPRAAAIAGRRTCVLRCTGDRLFGVFDPPGSDQRDALQSITADYVLVGEPESRETGGSNTPQGVHLDGTADYGTVPDAADLDYASGAFTVAVLARFVDTAGAYYASKGDIAGGADGWAIRRSAAATLQFFVNGAGGSGGPSFQSLDWFDDLTVAMGRTDGNELELWLDDEVVAAATVAHGAVTNGVAMVLGADNAGASGFARGLHCGLVVYPDALDDDEMVRLARYLGGHAGIRPPVDADRFYDLRDRRAYDGAGTFVNDLAGSGQRMTLVSSPTPVGRPADLTDLEVWR